MIIIIIVIRMLLVERGCLLQPKPAEEAAVKNGNQ